MLRGLVLGGALLGACYSPPLPCGVTCATSGECPGDATCSGGVCVAPEGTCPALDLRAISVGNRHVCALDSAGHLYCWGDNRRGQVGTGTNDIVIAAPVRVGEDIWDQLAVGTETSCALRGGEVYCWGNNAVGQADGVSTMDVTTPRKVEFPGDAPPPFEQLAIGNRHSCALGAGQLWCWGEGQYINKGLGTDEPVHIGPDDWTAVSAGYDHTCGLNATLGGLVCFGNNRHGHTGQPLDTYTPDPLPVPLPAELAGATLSFIEAGDEASCVIANGELWCWGNNSNLLLGAMATSTPTPTRIGTDSTWTSMRAGGGHHCGIRGGEAVCWGRSSFGGLGGGKWVEAVAYEDAVVVGRASIVDVWMGSSTPEGSDEISCLLDGTTASCWGDNSMGELGIGRPSRRYEPVEVAPPEGSKWLDVAAGQRHVCATTDDRHILCWGSDVRGQIAAGPGIAEQTRCSPGVPCSAARPTPGPAEMQRADELVLGLDWTCARDQTEIKCWGRDELNFLGGDPRNGIVTVQKLDNAPWTGLIGGHRGTCGVTAAGVIACWGDIPADLDQNGPIDPSIFANVVDVTFGDNVRCFKRTSDQSRLCWGTDANERLGNTPADGEYTTPTAIQSPDVKEVVMGPEHGCIVTVNHGVQCWGMNDKSQTGVIRAGNDAVATPTAVRGFDNQDLGNCSALALHFDHSCAICDGAAVCWGETRNGATGRTFGDPTEEHIALRVAVPGNPSFTKIAAYDDGACAIDSDGRMYCWGDGTYGQNGDGGAGSPIPVRVGFPAAP
jgi:alpha-tubulin suppressor-like RCC1 family protein